MKRFFTIPIYLASCILLTCSFARAGNGDLDTGFGANGIVITDIQLESDRVFAVLVQPDGKIVTGGMAGVAGNGNDFALARYNTNGSLDATFGTGGIVTTSLGSSIDAVYALALQPDGKIVAAGTACYLDNCADNAVAMARYETNGSLDTTFGPNGDGIVITNIADSAGDWASAVAMAGDRILVAGEATVGGLGEIALARYTADGSLDPTFGTGGIVTELICVGGAADMQMQPDGRILVGQKNCGQLAIVRFTADGQLDGSFGDLGYAISNFPGGVYGTSLALQPDGKIVTAGYSAGGDFAVARFDVNGVLDPTFDSDGMNTTDLGGHEFVGRVAVGTDGRIVVAGWTGDYPMADFALARYNADGSLDAGFGSAGKVITPIGNGTDDGIQALALQPDGKIIGAGWAGGGDSSYSDFALARYIGNASCMFCDDFEDGVLALDWTYTKPAWSESGGDLIGIPSGRKAEAVASPAFAGCSTCDVEASMTTAGGDYNKLWLLAWFQDKRNTVEVLMNEETNKWIVKQRSNGSVVAKGKGFADILPGTAYTVKVSYDGANFVLTVNGAQVATVAAAVNPEGTVGFRVKNTTGKFGHILVN